MIPPGDRHRRDVAQTMVANGTIVAISIVVGILSARLLGVEGRGEFAAIVLVPQLAFLLSVLGVHEAIVFHAARPRFTTEAILGSALAIGLPLAAAGTAASLLVSPWVLARYGASVRMVSAVYAASIPVGIVQGIMMRLLQGMRRFTLWNVFRVAAQAGALAVLLGLWRMHHLTAAAFAVGLLVSNTLMLLALGVAFRATGLLRATVDRDAVAALWRYAWRSGVGTVPQIANFRLDQVIIAASLSRDALGLYTAAVSWSTGFIPLVSAYGGVVFPTVAGAAEAPQRFARAMRSGLALLAGGWAVYFALTPLLFGAFYGPAFMPALPAVLVLGGAAVLLCANQMLAEGIKGLGLPMLVSVAEMAGLAATVLLLALLIPRFGIMGAAIASLAAYALTFAVLLAGLQSSAGCRWRELVLRRGEGRDLLRQLASAVLLPFRPANRRAGQP